MLRRHRSAYLLLPSPPLQYTVKKATGLPVPSRDVTIQTLPGRELLNYSRPGRVWSVTSRLGTGKPTIFLQCINSTGEPTWEAEK